MAKVELKCAVYGEKTVFPVKVALNAKVSALQEAIARVLSSDQHTVAPRLLTLYLARKPGENTWLKADRTLKAFLKSGPSTEYEEMVPACWLDEDYFGEGFQPARRDIHVLVELPEAQQAAASAGAISDRLSMSQLVASLPHKRTKPSSASVVGQEPSGTKKARSLTPIKEEAIQSIAENLDLDTWKVGGTELGIHHIEPDFPEWFYVRQETLDIIKIFKNNPLSTVFVGTPGVGKSMLVVLFAFHMALRQQKRIALCRKQNTGQKVGITILYLDVENKEYWRCGQAYIGDLYYLLGCRNADLCLDGFLDSEITANFEVLALFRLLATSCQYDIKDNDTPRLRQCLVPFWSKSDLNIVGAHYGWTEHSINDRYYYSGGNLRNFLLENDIIKCAVNQGVAGADLFAAELLKTQFGRTSCRQVDRIRMTGLLRHDLTTSIASDEDRESTLAKYFNCGDWICAITSEYAMRQLSEIVKPSYYEELWSNARMLGDDGLMGVAFENYVHTMVRNGEVLKLQMRTYDRSKRNSQHTYAAVEFTARSHRSDGKDAAECEATMRGLNGVDYWYPLNRCLATIDSVARLTVNDQTVASLIQITKADTHKVDSHALDKYAALFPTGAIYVALVPDKATSDRFRLSPANPPTQVPLYVAYIATWNV